MNVESKLTPEIPPKVITPSTVLNQKQQHTIHHTHLTLHTSITGVLSSLHYFHIKVTVCQTDKYSSIKALQVWTNMNCVQELNYQKQKVRTIIKEKTIAQLTTGNDLGNNEVTNSVSYLL